MTNDELIIDLFAGGGGASTGIEAALGRPIDIAIEHDATAIEMHTRNHPDTRHYQADVWAVSPREACAGRPVGLLWASPACTHFSRAKGAQNPLSAKIRSLASVVIRWAREVQPRVIFLENVEEFETWGPLDSDGFPRKDKAGTSFRVWLGKLKAQGYAVEWRTLVAADYGAPTTRKRLYLIARRDGQPIAWPEPTHSKEPSLFAAPWRTAAECIDWSVPVRSIFGRKRPLAEATLRRIAAGVMRYVVNNARPFIVPVKSWGGGGNDARSIDEPTRTTTASKRGEFAVVAPSLVQAGYGEREGQRPRALDIERLLGTVVAGGAKHALVTAFLLKYYGGSGNPESQKQSLFAPLGTVTTRDRFALVTVEGVEYAIADIGMRMLAAHELWRAQGFPESINVEGLTSTQQIQLCGNSVCPPVAEAIVRANFQRADGGATHAAA